MYYLARLSFVEVESEVNGRDDEHKRDNVVPARRLPKEQPSDHREHDNRDAFLHDLELHNREARGSDAIGRHLKDVFKKRQQPAYRDRDPERLVLVFQMPVPGERHEYVRNEQ